MNTDENTIVQYTLILERNGCKRNLLKETILSIMINTNSSFDTSTIYRKVSDILPWMSRSSITCVIKEFYELGFLEKINAEYAKHVEYLLKPIHVVKKEAHTYINLRHLTAY